MKIGLKYKVVTYFKHSILDRGFESRHSRDADGKLWLSKPEIRLCPDPI